jgi:DNA repair protein RecO (recombination protein O)
VLVQTPAVVLKSFPFGDTSLIARCYTREQGKIGILIKGARRKKSSFGAYFQPMNHVELVYYFKATRELQILSKVTFLDLWSSINDSLKKLSYGLAVIELTDKTNTELDPHIELFDELVQVLRQLNNQEHKLNLIFWYYEIRLLTILGFKPDFSQREFKGITLPDPNAGPNSAAILNMLNNHSLLNRDGLTSLDNVKVTSHDRKAISDYLSTYLLYHFESISDMKSLKVLKDILV